MKKLIADVLFAILVWAFAVAMALTFYSGVIYHINLGS